MFRHPIYTENGILLHCKKPVEWIDCPCGKEECYASRCRICKALEKDCEEYQNVR